MTNDQDYIQVEGRDKNESLVSIFLPTTPNPTSGFYLMLPREDVKVIDLAVEEAFKLIMSAGIVVPEGSRFATALESEGGEIHDVENKDGLSS